MIAPSKDHLTSLLGIIALGLFALNFHQYVRYMVADRAIPDSPPPEVTAHPPFIWKWHPYPQPGFERKMDPALPDANHRLYRFRVPGADHYRFDQERILELETRLKRLDASSEAV